MSTTETISAPWSTITNPKALAAALRNAALFASSDEIRPVLCCVEMIADEDRLRIISTDSYLLLVQELIVGREGRLDHETGRGEWHALVHRDSLRMMLALLQGVKDTPCDLFCGHDAPDLSHEAEMTVSVNGGPEIPLARWHEMAAAVGPTEDGMLVAAAHLVVGQGIGAVTMLQRRLRISFSRAERLMVDLEQYGVVGPRDGDGPRQVLLNEEQLGLRGFLAPTVDDPVEEVDDDAPAKPSTSELSNAGELTLKVADAELVLPLFDEGVFPTWEKILERDVRDVDGGRFGAHVIKRLGSLQLPTNDDPILDWTFCGENAPVLFTVENYSPDLAMRGAFMPIARDRKPEEEPTDA